MEGLLTFKFLANDNQVKPVSLDAPVSVMLEHP